MGIFDLFKSKKKKEEANKYRIGMEKTRKSGAFSRLKRLFSNYNEITEDLNHDKWLVLKIKKATPHLIPKKA